MLPRSVTTGPNAARDRMHEAARSLESIFLKQLITSSGAFGGGEGAGSSVRADLFASTLADTLAKYGGIGLAAQLERSLDHSGGPPLAPVPAPGAPASTDLTAPARTFALPVAGRVTSGFGARVDPITGAPAHHGGLDVAAPEGTSIRAAAGGTVVAAGARGGYGDAVEVDHGDGTSTLYAHASQLLVRTGDRVEAGQEIARVGHSGRATGPHLHFEVRKGARAIDPSRALKEYRLRADGSLGVES